MKELTPEQKQIYSDWRKRMYAVFNLMVEHGCRYARKTEEDIGDTMIPVTECIYIRDKETAENPVRCQAKACEIVGHLYSDF